MIGEWIFLKKARFPFEIPVTTLLIRISSLDASPLVEMLKKKYGYIYKAKRNRGIRLAYSIGFYKYMEGNVLRIPKVFII